jgi:flagellar protein FliS
MTGTDFAYRKTAAEGASGFGLLVALYDTLAGDLRRAAEAERSNNVEKRTREVNHALLVIAHLEDWLQHGSDGDLAKQLAGFYSSIRQAVLDAQVARSAHKLEEQMARVLEIRKLWQDSDFHKDLDGPEILPPAKTPSYLPSYAPDFERVPSTWSA